MICKFCKSEIPDTSLTCPACGKTLYEVRQRPMPEVEEETEIKPVFNFVPLISGVLAVVAIIIAIVATVSVKKNAALLSDNTNTEVARLEQRISVLEYKLKDMEDKSTASQSQSQLPPPTLPGNTAGQTAGQTTAPDTNAEKLTIVANPTGEEREIGYKSGEGRYLFGFAVEGDLEGFKWEKKQTNGSWAQIDFDDKGFNKQYGLSVLIDMTDGSTKLVASGLTAASAGEYKCTAFGKAGDKLEATVTLKIVEPEKEAAQTGGTQGTQGQVQQPQQNQDFDDETMDGFMG